jgi:hypothetical protein
MKFLAVGDSFTFGEELSDVTDNVTSSKFAWPELLAAQLGWEVTNLAKPASGNSRMVRNVVNEIDNYEVFIIAWSHWARIEFADDIGIFDIWPGCSALPHEHSGPHRKNAIDYITRYHNDDYLIKQYLLNVELLETFLKYHKKKYIMLSAFGFPIRTTKTFTNYLGWPNETMMEWTYRTPQGPGGHFLEQGHVIVANKINEYIRHLGWVS